MLPTDPVFNPSTRLLETARLLVRVDTENDYREKFRDSSDEELKQYFGIVTDEALHAQKQKVEAGMSTYRTSLVFFHLINRTDGQVIGNAGFHNWFPMHSRSEIGYMIFSEDNKRKGYMREALPAIVDFGFREMHLNRIEAFISPDNQPSRRLVERLGFRQEGHLRAHYFFNDAIGDTLVYGLLLGDRSSDNTN